MISIDGSRGEGGGQMLRSSLALSMATGRAFRMMNIRAGREKPGLMRQHLTCVNAAAAICSGEVTGANVGSSAITFSPGPVRSGEYRFPVGTAGSTTMVLQAVLPALMCADGRSVVTVEGGTHNSKAPPFEFFQRTLLPLLARCGVSITSRMDRPGFYPAGGGRVVVEIEPAAATRPLDLTTRGTHQSTRAAAYVSRLPFDIAERELAAVSAALGLDQSQTHVIGVPSPVGPGNALLVEIAYEHVTEVVSALGALGKPADEVAREAADAARAYMDDGLPVGEHLADQLMVPLAILHGGRYAARLPLSMHAQTNIETLAAFGARAYVDTENNVVVEPMHTR